MFVGFQTCRGTRRRRRKKEQQGLKCLGSHIMDPRMYNAAEKGAMQDGDFSLDEHLKIEEENGYQVTPNGNTILHVATLFGQRGFIMEVLEVTPGLLCYKNKKNESALHIAANVGQSEVVSELLSVRGGETTLVRMTDDNGDTALHKAVRGGHVEIVRMLVRLLVDPELDFPANKAGETPLYLAAESGFHDVLIEFLNICKDPTCVAGPSKRTPLHAAVIQEHKECARSLWQWNNYSCEEADEWGWNSLHYAVKQGLKDLVSDMLEWKKSLAYIPAGNENDWTTALHIAASEGDIFMTYELLKHCPDCCDMVNSKGQNALHVAILNHQEVVVPVLLVFKIFLVDEADNEGNTPLHLLAAYWDYVPKIVLAYARAKKMPFNKQNQTPLDIALSRTWTLSKEKLVADFCSINGRLGQRDFKINRKTRTMRKVEQMSDEDSLEKAKIEIEKIMKAAQTQLVVATLIVTVTFAAGFTLPGGVESDDGPNKGTAILLKKAAFRAFVISDLLAFIFSVGAIFIYDTMSSINKTIGNEVYRTIYFSPEFSLLKVLQRLYNIAANLQFLAMTLVVVAFVTGMYAMLANSFPLAVSVCVIGCGSFLMYYVLVWILLLRDQTWISLLRDLKDFVAINAAGFTNGKLQKNLQKN